MRSKVYSLRSVASHNGQERPIQLSMEFEGKRAFAIVDSIPVGSYVLTTRIELDPALLEKVRTSQRQFHYFYRGEIILPRPENN